MPTYEFTCKDCQHHFEVFIAISKKNTISCPECNSKKLQEAFGVFFVGGNVTHPGAGQGAGCDGSCGTCSSTCKQ